MTTTIKFYNCLWPPLLNFIVACDYHLKPENFCWSEWQRRRTGSCNGDSRHSKINQAVWIQNKEVSLWIRQWGVQWAHQIFNQESKRPLSSPSIELATWLSRWLQAKLKTPCAPIMTYSTEPSLQFLALESHQTEHIHAVVGSTYISLEVDLSIYAGSGANERS